MSPDSMFTRILGRLDDQDRSATEWRKDLKQFMTEIQAEMTAIKTEVEKLKRWRLTIKTRIALLIVLGASAATFIGWALNLWVSWKH